MSLAQQITEDMKIAMKSKNDATLSTLRLLRSAIKNKQIDLMHELSDVEIENVINTQVKQLKDAIVSFESGGRHDLADSNKHELEVLSFYLPKEMSDEDLSLLVETTIKEAGPLTKSDMGKAMGLCVKAVAGRADGSRVKTAVEKLLIVVFLVFLFEFAVPSFAFAAFDAFLFPSFTPFVETMLRILRVFFLWGGVFCLNDIIHGGFAFTNDGVCDDVKKVSMKRVTNGCLGLIAVVGVFIVLTMIIGT